MPVLNYDWDDIEDNIIEKYDDASVTVAEYTTEPSLYGNVISQNRSGVESQFHFDAPGSTLALTDNSQQVTDVKGYSAFGEPTENTGGTAFPFQYIGQKGYYFDDSVGHLSVRGRLYRPTTGRFLTLDLLEHAGLSSQYAYVWNSPVSVIDPSGLFGISNEFMTPLMPALFAQSPTQAPTKPPTQPPTKPPTQPPTKPPTKPPTQPPTKPPTQPPGPDIPRDPFPAPEPNSGGNSLTCAGPRIETPGFPIQIGGPYTIPLPSLPFGACYTISRLVGPCTTTGIVVRGPSCGAFSNDDVNRAVNDVVSRLLLGTCFGGQSCPNGQACSGVVQRSTSFSLIPIPIPVPLPIFGVPVSGCIVIALLNCKIDSTDRVGKCCPVKGGGGRDNPENPSIPKDPFPAPK